MSTISDHNLVDITPKLKKPRINPCKVTVRSYKNYKVGNFLHDLSLTPFHIISVFDDLNDQVDAFPDLFWDVQNNCAPIENKGSSSLEWIQIFRLEGDPVAEKAYVRAQIVESRGHSNSTWKVTNRYLPRKNQDGSMDFEDPTGLANSIKELFTSVGSLSARKASELAS